jgi:hypothetical protein
MIFGPEQMLTAIGAATIPVTGNGVDREPPLRTFTSHDFTGLRLKPRDFILEPILRTGSLAMLSAFRGVGKTQVAVGMAHAVATG